MRRAEVRERGKQPGPCPNCGAVPHEALDVVTAQGRVAIGVCKACWGRAVIRGQVETVAQLCRLADDGGGVTERPRAARARMEG